MNTDLEAIYKKSSHHRKAVEGSSLCGCFCCLEIYPSTEIKEWVARDNDNTAVCPRCAIDSVLPESGIVLTLELLTAMRSRWFPGIPR